MARSPNWTRDELILALSLYMRSGRRYLESSHPEVAQLSKLLNELPIHEQAGRGITFRNPQGVSMKLGNFMSLDPLYPGAGLQRGGRLDQEVWEEFSGDLPRLYQTADSISAAASRPPFPTEFLGPAEEEFPEGRLLTHLHHRKERNPRAVERKKREALDRYGRLACEACGFDFAEAYGPLGEGFAECHHTTPVAQLGEGESTRLRDLAILCANCHRMIHRSRPLLTVAGLRSIALRARP